MKSENAPQWHHLPGDELLHQLESSLERGLDSSEVERRTMSKL